MKEIVRGIYDPIQKQYWKKIPKERVDEAVMACKKKYQSRFYVFTMFGLLLQMGMVFIILRDCAFKSNDLGDIISSIFLLLFLLVCGLYAPGYVLLEDKIIAHKIKTGKAWIKSGKILTFEKKNSARKLGKHDVIFNFLCQEGHNQVIYMRDLLYKNSRKVIPEQDVTVVVVDKELIILNRYYPEYAGNEGTFIVRNNPEMIQNMERYGYYMGAYEFCQEIWEKYVPETGKSKALQGELLRLTEFLRSNAMDKNKNWNSECEDACDFLEYYFVYDEENGVSDKNKMQQIISCIRERGRNKEAYEKLVLFDYIEDEIADIYLEKREAIRYRYYTTRYKDSFWEEEMKTQKIGTKSKKHNGKIVWRVVSVVFILFVFIFLIGRDIWHDQKTKKTDSGIMLDVPVVQVDGNTLEVGGKLIDIYESEYACMTEIGDVYSGNNWIKIVLAPKENMQLYIVKEGNDRKNSNHSFNKTGIQVTVTNTGQEADTALVCEITKIVINERENLYKHILLLDGIETKNLDRNAAVDELQQTGVKFDEEETQKFVNGKIDRLVSDSANYRYIIKASQVYKQVILEVECLK